MEATATIGIEQGIRERAKEFADAWNRHDVRTMVSFWKEDGDLITPFGRVARGRADVEKLFEAEHKTYMKDTTFTIERQDIRMIRPDLALCEWDHQITGLHTAEGVGIVRVHGTILMEKQGGNWYVVASRPVIYAPIPQQ